MRRKFLVSISLLALLALASGYAQQQIVRAKIPFQFTAAGKVLPAGEYEFTRASNDELIRVAGGEKGSAVLATVITRLGAGIHTTAQDCHIVFDNVGGANFLSEVWISGADGFLLYSAKGKHEHRTVDVPR